MNASFSGNAIWAKAKAKFGGRLTPQNYNELLACRSVGEIALYLKGHTYFSSVLGEVKSSDIHRGRLEELLKRKQFEDFASLCIFEYAGHDFFYQIIIIRSEIQQILHCIRLLNFGRPDEYLFRMPAFLDRHTTISLLDLARARNFDEMLQSLQGSRYYKILRPFTPAPGEELNFTAIETALNEFLYEELFRLFKRRNSGRHMSEIEQMYAQRAELGNILRIIRLKRNPHISVEYIRSCLMPYRYLLSAEELEKMVNASTSDQVLELFRKSRYQPRIENVSFVSLEQCVQEIIFNHAVHTMHFSSNPSAIFAAYVIASETELTNVVHIIEGIRYQLDPSEIKPMLILES